MSGTRHTDIEAARLYGEAIERMAAGRTIPEACAELGVSPATFHRWRRKFGVQFSAAVVPSVSAGNRRERSRKLETENARLKLLVGELALEIAFLKDALPDSLTKISNPWE